MKCRSCGKEIPDNSKLCPECGVQVIWDVPCAACGKNIPAGVAKCPECGESIIRC